MFRGVLQYVECTLQSYKSVDVQNGFRSLSPLVGSQSTNIAAPQTMPKPIIPPHDPERLKRMQNEKLRMTGVRSIDLIANAGWSYRSTKTTCCKAEGL